jgi:hypothetical protein
MLVLLIKLASIRQLGMYTNGHTRQYPMCFVGWLLRG